MPAEIRRRRMSIDEYHLLPFHPGWKVEYFDGEAVFQPRENCAHGTMAVLPRTEPDVEGVSFRGLDPLDAPGLSALFRAVFSETPEYAGWPADRFEVEPRKVIEDFFSGKRGAVCGATRLVVSDAARANDGAIIGAALVVEHGARAALLDVLMIAPGWQRRGIASTLGAVVLAALARSGHELFISRWHLANESSIDWHRRLGFREEPDFLNAKLYLRASEHELWRLEKLGQLTAEKRAELTETQQHWQREVARLEALIDAGDKNGAFACFRFGR
ncbi:MAG: GNAT family N-acetyltransferase [Chthoniobacteraceae bacterium]